MSESKYFSKDELHCLACNFIVDNYLKHNGFELASGFPRPEYPNIVCRKNGQLYGIVVIPSIFPNYEIMTDNFRIKTVELCKKENTIALFAPVGFKSKNEEAVKEKVIKKTDELTVFFPGFIVLNDNEKQNLDIKANEFVKNL